MGRKISAYNVRVKVHIQSQLFSWHTLTSIIDLLNYTITVLVTPTIFSSSVTQPYFNYRSLQVADSPSRHLLTN